MRTNSKTYKSCSAEQIPVVHTIMRAGRAPFDQKESRDDKVIIANMRKYCRNVDLLWPPQVPLDQTHNHACTMVVPNSLLNLEHHSNKRSDTNALLWETALFFAHYNYIIKPQNLEYK